MNYRITGLAAVIAVVSTAAGAQGFTGASANAEFRDYYGDDRDTSSYTLDAGAEFNLGGDFGVGGNFSLGRDDDTDFDYTNVTAHGLYLFSPNAAFGVFASQDSVDGQTATNYGLEFGGRSNGGRYEVYYGQVDLSGDGGSDLDLSLFGASFEFAAGSGFSFGLQYESISGFPFDAGTADASDITLSDTSVIARYNFLPEASIYAEVGTLGTAVIIEDTAFTSDADINYVSIGAEFAIGPDRANIFGARSFSGFGF